MVWSDPIMGKLPAKEIKTLGRRRYEAENLLAEAVPNLFVVGPPPMDGVSVRFAANWLKGVLCIYIPREMAGRIPASILKRADKVKARFSTIVIKYVVYDDKFVWPERHLKAV